MKAIKQQMLAIPLIFILLLATIPLGIAAPLGTKESDVVKYAKSWIGVKYIHEGNSRASIDCSHLVYQVYSKAGARKIYFMKVSDIKKNPYYKVVSSPRPGDIILWKKDVTKNGKKYWLAGHVGIYIGNGQFIHASDEIRKVTTNSVSGMYKTGQPYYARWSHT
jgi:cell wall-associated NlpC family hydrolase